jgi:hypothetical protein
MKLTQLGHPAIVFSFAPAAVLTTCLRRSGKAMKYQLVIGLFFAVVLALLGDSGYKVKYDGGSLSNTTAGTDMKMYISATDVRFLKGNAELAKIPASAITEISYGQDVDRILGPAVAGGVLTPRSGGVTALSNPNKRLVGVTWSNGDHTGGLAVQCDEDDCRSVLARLEGVSGKIAVELEASTVKN